MPDIYVGSSKIKSQEVQPDGRIKVVLLEPQGVPPILYFTADQFKDVQSDTPYSDGDISIKKWRNGTAKMLAILLENHMEMGDMSFVINRLRESLMKNYEASVSKLFGVQYEDLISLQQIDEVLKSK